MDSVNFTRLLCTPTSAKRKLIRTFIKPKTRNSFSSRKLQEHAKKFEASSNILKDIGLTECDWETYQVNALYYFSYNRRALFEYQEILAKKIKESILKSDDDKYNSAEINVRLEKFRETAFTEKDSPALKFTITASDIYEGHTDEYEEVFSVLLLSVERKIGFKENERLSSGAVILPLLLVAIENEIIKQSFIDFLEENFSCLVSPLKFSSTDLKWILALFSFPDSNTIARPTVLEYKTPIEELESIDYITDAKSMHTLWNELIKSNTELITEDHVNEFLSCLENYFYKRFNIDLSCLELQTVRTHLGIVKREVPFHRIQVYDSSKLYFVMRYLTHVAQEIAS